MFWHHISRNNRYANEFNSCKYWCSTMSIQYIDCSHAIRNTHTNLHTNRFENWICSLGFSWQFNKKSSLQPHLMVLSIQQYKRFSTLSAHTYLIIPFDTWWVCGCMATWWLLFQTHTLIWNCLPLLFVYVC